jgi:hypothetical protein
MMKSLLIVLLAVALSACAAPGTGADNDALTFEQIAGEISVRHELLDTSADLSQSTARNDANAG